MEMYSEANVAVIDHPAKKRERRKKWKRRKSGLHTRMHT